MTRYIALLRLIRLLIIVIILIQINLKGTAIYADTPVKFVRASFYSDNSICGSGRVKRKCGGRITKWGTVFDENKLTAACPVEMKWKRVKLQNPLNARIVEVLCTDTGNFAKYGRDIDLALRPAEELEIVDSGVATLIVISIT